MCALALCVRRMPMCTAPRLPAMCIARLRPSIVSLCIISPATPRTVVNSSLCS